MPRDSSIKGSPCARLTELARYAVLDPLRAPPVDRRDRSPAQQHREMQMITAGESGRSAASKLLVHPHAVAALHADGREVRVQRLQTHAMIDDHAVSVNAEVPGMNHRAAVCGQHWRR